MFFGSALIVVGWGVVGWDRKYYLGPAEIATFSSRDFRQSNKHDPFCHAVSTGYFYVLFLWAIAVSDFRHLGIYKDLGLPLSTIPFRVNSHADNYFIYFKYYTALNRFIYQIHVKVFYIQISFKSEHRSYFSSKNHGLHKNSF